MKDEISDIINLMTAIVNLVAVIKIYKHTKGD